MYIAVNSLALGNFGCNLKLSIFKQMSKVYVLDISYEIALNATVTNWYIKCQGYFYMKWEYWSIM